MRTRILEVFALASATAYKLIDGSVNEAAVAGRSAARRDRDVIDRRFARKSYWSSLTPRMAKTIYVLNGPNLNLLGTREPEVYGHETLGDIEERTRARAKSLGLEVDFRQSNSEGELIGWVQEARGKASGLIVNAGALTHTSVGLLDAMQAVSLPAIEVHLSNIFRRESFRQHSYISLAANGVICGLGAIGYELAIEAMGRHLLK